MTCRKPILLIFRARNVPPSPAADCEGHARPCVRNPVVRLNIRASTVAILLIGLVAATPVCADQIVMGELNYTSAKIVGMEDGQLRFRSADGGLHNVWLDEVQFILVDRRGIFDDFNQAEKFLADGQSDRAVVRYGRALRLAEGFWTDVIAVRMVLACDAAGQLDNTVMNFLRVALGEYAGPAAAARLFPGVIPEKRSKRAQRAVEQLNLALSKDPDESRRSLFELLLYEILSRTGDERAVQVAPRIVGLTLPAAVRTPEVYAIQLRALRESLGTGAVEPLELAGLNRAMRDCPRAMLPEFLLLKGETLLRTASTRDDLIRAAWPFLRAAIHFPDSQQAPEGLYGAALVLERIGRTDKAVDLLAECLAHKRISEEVRTTAEAARARMQSAPPP